MPNRPPNPPETRPGDVIGQDEKGEWHVDRKIPSVWLFGIAAGIVMQAIVIWFQVQQLIASVSEMKSEFRALSVLVNDGARRDAIHELRFTEHSRRLDEQGARITDLERERKRQ